MIEQLITDHLDLWSSAVRAKSSAGRGSNSKLELTGIKKLRELILELAVRGKLVPQDPNDEPASVLLERIAAEKARLVKEGKIKKSKPLPEITEEEIPFELPEGWCVVRLGTVVDRISNGFSGAQNKEGDGYPLSRIETISNSVVNLDRVGYSTSIPDDKLNYYKLSTGDILLSHINSDYHVGKTAVFEGGDLYHGVNLLLIRISYLVSFRFIDLRLNQLRLSGYFISVAQHAIGQSSINQSIVQSVVVPLPPIEEQHRIVVKVDELMSLCDQLEQKSEASLAAHQTLVETLLATLTESADSRELAQNWARLAQHFDSLFTTQSSIDALKQTILQLAVMGKLVPQDPNDEPASVLLERIATEKARLVKEGKLKKEKPLPPISEEEKPFALPDGWEWCKFGFLAEFINGDRGKNYPNQNEYVDSGVAWINTGHIQPDGSLSTSDMNFITKEKFDSLRGGKIRPDDLVYCLRGATFGKTAFVKPYIEGAIASSLMIIRHYERDSADYTYRYLLSPFGRSQIFRFDNGSAQPNLSANSVTLYAYPCPPLKEQHRIIAKVDELMSLCDQLSARLQASQTTQLHLAEALVEGALN